VDRIDAMRVSVSAVDQGSRAGAGDVALRIAHLADSNFVAIHLGEGRRVIAAGGHVSLPPGMHFSSAQNLAPASPLP
jgi:hypothetical protein